MAHCYLHTGLKLLANLTLSISPSSPGSRFQQLGSDPEWAARQGKRREEQRRRGSDSDGSDSEVEEDGILQRTGQSRLHSQVLSFS